MTDVDFTRAKREAVGLLIGLAGASGSGKSFSALALARGLAGDQPFAVIDTEARRMLHYADQFQPWDHAELKAPFTPARYADAIAVADKAGYPVIVIDSASHEHAGEGGLLDMQEAEWAKSGRRDNARMSSWIKPKGEHKRFVSRLLQVRAHLILCLRAEEKIEMVTVEENGQRRTKVVPKRSLTGLDGWVPVCERNLPFELTLSLLLTPDAPGVPKPIKLQDQHRSFVPLDAPLTVQTGRDLARWAGGDQDLTAEEQREGELIGRLLEIADRLGTRADVTKAIAANRRRNGSGSTKHAEWLVRQIEKGEERLAEQPEGEALFA